MVMLFIPSGESHLIIIRPHLLKPLLGVFSSLSVCVCVCVCLCLLESALPALDSLSHFALLMNSRDKSAREVQSPETIPSCVCMCFVLLSLLYILLFPFYRTCVCVCVCGGIAATNRISDLSSFSVRYTPPSLIHSLTQYENSPIPHYHQLCNEGRKKKEETGLGNVSNSAQCLQCKWL